jgi:hypothetical protein
MILINMQAGCKLVNYVYWLSCQKMCIQLFHLYLPTAPVLCDNGVHEHHDVCATLGEKS